MTTDQVAMKGTRFIVTTQVAAVTVANLGANPLMDIITVQKEVIVTISVLSGRGMTRRA
jgi:hypothetical protein